MIKTLFLYIAIFCGSILTLNAQVIPSDTLRVTNIAQDHGLSQLNALSLDFDDLGYLWVSTENGLNRFNGYNMAVFKAGKGPGKLPDDHVRDMYQANDTLWLATNTRSVCAYLLAENRFVSFEDSLDLNRFPGAKYAYTLTPLTERFLLAGTIDHCILIDRNGPNFTIINVSGKTDNEYITSVSKYDENLFLLSTNFRGTYVFNLAERSVTPFHIRNLIVNTFFDLDSNRLLVGSNKGLFIHEKQTGNLHRVNIPIKDGTVRSLFQWDAHNIFVGGINRNYLLDKELNSKELIFTDNAGKALQTTVLCLKEDDQGGKWMGTEGRGVMYHHPHHRKFSSYRIKTDRKSVV